jgi:hypothetical protein
MRRRRRRRRVKFEVEFPRGLGWWGAFGVE